MTLVGINWFAVAIAVAANMLYGHYFYLPRVATELAKLSEKDGKTGYQNSKTYLYLFVHYLALAIAVWNLRSLPQFMGRNTVLIFIWIWIPFFFLPRFATKAVERSNEKLFSLEIDHYIIQVIITGIILRVAIG